MKKLLLATVATIVTLSAVPSFADGYKKGMDKNWEPTVENITKRMERRLERNPNLKLDSVAEADGKFTVRIITKDGSLVEEKIIDPSQKRGGYRMMSTPLTVERTKEILEGHMAMRGNSNVKIGDITEVDGKIKASIVTQDGSLVNEAEIDPEKPFEGLGKLTGMEHMMKDHGERGKGHMMGRNNGRSHHRGGDMEKMGERMKEKFENMDPEQKEKFMTQHKEMMEMYDGMMVEEEGIKAE